MSNPSFFPLPVLVGPGIGEIHIMDDDVVEESNLHRQTLYRMDDIGRSKAEAAALHPYGLNPISQYVPMRWEHRKIQSCL